MTYCLPSFLVPVLPLFLHVEPGDGTAIVTDIGIEGLGADNHEFGLIGEPYPARIRRLVNPHAANDVAAPAMRAFTGLLVHSASALSVQSRDMGS